MAYPLWGERCRWTKANSCDTSSSGIAPAEMTLVPCRMMQ
jgi:hypothetical protein